MNVPVGVKPWAGVESSLHLPVKFCLPLATSPFFCSPCSSFLLTTFLYHAFTQRPSHLVPEGNRSMVVSTQYGRIKVDVAQFGDVAEAVLLNLLPIY